MVVKMENKKNIKTLTIILMVVGILAILFTISMVILFYKFQSIPDTLCERFFTCVVGELGIAGVIQVVKTIFKNKTQTQTDETLDTSEEMNEEIVSNDYTNNLEI